MPPAIWCGRLTERLMASDGVRLPPSSSGVEDGRSLSNGGIVRGCYRYSPRGGARDGATGGHQPVRARRRGAFSSSCRPPWIASSRAPTRAGFNRIRSVPIRSIETKNVNTDNEVCARSNTRMGLKGTLLDYNY